ncbi:MAG: flippase [Myxococcota bacterium]|nr:flippase [Myxococcota bacterium]
MDEPDVERSEGASGSAEPIEGASGSAEPIAGADEIGGRGIEIGGRLLARNTLLNLVGQVVPIIVVLLAVPFLIGRLGEDRAGILAVTLGIMNFSTLFDLGLGRALRKRVAEVLGKGERKQVPGIVATTLVAQLACGSLGGLVLAAITPLLVERLLQIPPELHAEARTTFFLVALAMPLAILIDSLSGALEAAQRFDLVNAMRVPFILSTAVLPLVAVLVGWDLTGIMALQVGAIVVFFGVHCAVCVWELPEIIRQPRFDREELRRLLGFGRWVLVSNAISPLLMYLDRLIIGTLLGMAAVTAYTAPFELVTRLSLVPASLAATLFPAFSALAGQGRHDVLERYAGRAARYLLMFLGPVVLLVIVFSRWILEHWLGSELADDSAVALSILAVGVLVNALAHVPFSLVQARNRPDLTALFHLIELPVYAVLVWVLVGRWGIAGAAMAWTVRVTVDAALLFLVSARLSKSAIAERPIAVAT